MNRELFIYWRVLPGHTEQALSAARRVQQALCAEYPSLVARLYQRPDATGHSATLMETYAQVGGMGEGLLRSLEQQTAAALESWCDGGRHLEVFLPADDPAAP